MEKQNTPIQEAIDFIESEIMHYKILFDETDIFKRKKWEAVLDSLYQTKRKLESLLPKEKEVKDNLLNAFADYVCSEGCSCCRDVEKHEKAEERIAQILQPEKYKDGSGYDWSRYKTFKQK